MAYLGREAAKAPLVTADLPNDGVTLAKMAGGTDGQIITYNASGDPVAVGPGTNGQVLTSTGADSPPAFEAAGGGKVLQVKHDMISSRFLCQNSETVIWTGDTLTLSSSSNKVLVLGDFSVGANKGGSIKLQYSTNDGGSYSNISTADLGSMDNYHAGVAVMGWYFNFTEHISEMSALQSSFTYLHPPGNVSAKYRLSLNSGDSSYYVSINRRAQEADYGGLSWVTQMEISV